METKTPKEIDALLEAWNDNSGFCNFWNQMIKQEGYAELVEIGQPVVPRILRLISKGEIWIGFSHLLCLLTKEQPEYTPETYGNSLIAAFDVRAFAQSWLDWAVTKGIEIPND